MINYLHKYPVVAEQRYTKDELVAFERQIDA